MGRHDGHATQTTIQLLFQWRCRSQMDMIVGIKGQQHGGEQTIIFDYQKSICIIIASSLFLCPRKK
jgi:hypothetical protein